MYTGFLHTHKLVVTLFLLIYLIKTILLLLNKTDALGKFKKYTGIPEMIISALFLLTGIYLLFNSANIGVLTITKIGLVVISIPVAIIAFKRQNKLLAVFSLLIIVSVYGLAEMNKKQMGKISMPPVALKDNDGSNPISTDGQLIGKYLYEEGCKRCHGINGDACLNGAKNLMITTLSRAEQIKIIRNGKNAMPAYSELTDAQVNELVNYVNTLRNKKAPQKNEGL